MVFDSQFKIYWILIDKALLHSSQLSNQNWTEKESDTFLIDPANFRRVFSTTRDGFKN